MDKRKQLFETASITKPRKVVIANHLDIFFLSNWHRILWSSGNISPFPAIVLTVSLHIDVDQNRLSNPFDLRYHAFQIKSLCQHDLENLLDIY